MSKAAKSIKADTQPETIEELLLEGERVISYAVIHPAIYWKAAAVFGLGVLVGLFIAAELGVVLGIAGVLMGITAVMRKTVLMLVVTNKRILARYGLLQMDVVDMHFDKVESVELERMPPGMIFGYANVVIMGTGNRYIVIPYVANGRAVRRAYNEQSLGTS